MIQLQRTIDVADLATYEKWAIETYNSASVLIRSGEGDGTHRISWHESRANAAQVLDLLLIERKVPLASVRWIDSAKIDLESAVLIHRKVKSMSVHRHCRTLSLWAGMLQCEGDHRGAIRVLTEILDLGGSANAYTRRADNYEALFQYDEALRDRNRALLQAGDSFMSHMKRAQTNLLYARPEEALKDIGRVPAEQFNDSVRKWKLLHLRGRVMAALGHHMAAIKDFNRVIDVLSGKRKAVLFDRAMSLLKLDQVDEALSQFEEVHRTSGSRYRILSARAAMKAAVIIKQKLQAYLAQGQSSNDLASTRAKTAADFASRAMSLYDTARRALPDPAEVSECEAAIHELVRLSGVDYIAPQVTSADKVKTDTIAWLWAQFECLTAYSHIFGTRRLEIVCRRLIELVPEDSLACSLQLARIYAESNHVPSVIRVLQAATVFGEEHFMRSGEWRNLAWRELYHCHREMHDQKAAMEDVTQMLASIETDKGMGSHCRKVAHTSALLKRAELFEDMGQFEKAAAELEHILKIDPKNNVAPLRLKFARRRLAGGSTRGSKADARRESPSTERTRSPLRATMDQRRKRRDTSRSRSHSKTPRRSRSISDRRRRSRSGSRRRGRDRARRSRSGSRHRRKHSSSSSTSRPRDRDRKRRRRSKSKSPARRRATSGSPRRHRTTMRARTPSGSHSPRRIRSPPPRGRDRSPWREPWREPRRLTHGLSRLTHKDSRHSAAAAAAAAPASKRDGASGHETKCEDVEMTPASVPKKGDALSNAAGVVHTSASGIRDGASVPITAAITATTRTTTATATAAAVAAIPTPTPALATSIAATAPLSSSPVQYGGNAGHSVASGSQATDVNVSVTASTNDKSAAPLRPSASPQEVGRFLSGIGASYLPYFQASVDNHLDGEMLYFIANQTNPNAAYDLLRCAGVENKLHQRCIFQRLTTLTRQ